MVADGETVVDWRASCGWCNDQGNRGFQGRHDKVRIFKMRRRKHYQKHQVIVRTSPNCDATQSEKSGEERETWHTKKRAVVPVTAATHIQNDWA